MPLRPPRLWGENFKTLVTLVRLSGCRIWPFGTCEGMDPSVAFRAAFLRFRMCCPYPTIRVNVGYRQLCDHFWRFWGVSFLPAYPRAFPCYAWRQR